MALLIDKLSNQIKISISNSSKIGREDPMEQ